MEARRVWQAKRGDDLAGGPVVTSRAISSGSASINSSPGQRLDQLVAWSGRNDFHPITMTWAYGGGDRVQIDMFDIETSDEEMKAEAADIKLSAFSSLRQEAPIRLLEEQARGRAGDLVGRLYVTARESSPQTQRRLMGCDVQGDWVTADLVARSDLRLFFGILDQPLDAEQVGVIRREHRARRFRRQPDRIEVAATGRILVVVARGGAQPTDWAEVTTLVE